ncbi:MAG TPA: GNAT family N-acetyltransferase, partial [Burkholderiaceae bacterium]|nr:GNAT family N-acetyltransferase [Burkholderiaceae bacterium]
KGAIIATLMTVSLKEVTRDTLRAICKLDAGDGATQVAPNAVSIAEASFYGEAWFRAIYNDEVPVGFVMLYDPTLTDAPEEPDFFLWRLMIDKAHQGRGLGHAAVDLLITHVRARPGAKKLLVSHMSKADALARFYGSFGFVHTGQEEDGEKVMALEL